MHTFKSSCRSYRHSGLPGTPQPKPWGYRNQVAASPSAHVTVPCTKSRSHGTAPWTCPLPAGKSELALDIWRPQNSETSMREEVHIQLQLRETLCRVTSRGPISRESMKKLRQSLEYDSATRTTQVTRESLHRERTSDIPKHDHSRTLHADSRRGLFVHVHQVPRCPALDAWGKKRAHSMVHIWPHRAMHVPSRASVRFRERKCRVQIASHEGPSKIINAI